MRLAAAPFVYMYDEMATSVSAAAPASESGSDPEREFTAGGGTRLRVFSALTATGTVGVKPTGRARLLDLVPWICWRNSLSPLHPPPLL